MRTTGAVVGESSLPEGREVCAENGSPLALAVLLRGSVRLAVAGAAALPLGAGDVAVVSGGAPYVIGVDPDVTGEGGAVLATGLYALEGGVPPVRMLDLMLVTALRTWFNRPESAAPGWYRAYGDPVVGPVLRLLHGRPADPWTVQALAAELLDRSDATIAAVAGRVGFATAFSLSSAFKRERGLSPGGHRAAGAGERPAAVQRAAGRGAML